MCAREPLIHLTARASYLTARASFLQAQANYRRDPMGQPTETGQRATPTRQLPAEAGRRIPTNNPGTCWSQRVNSSAGPAILSSVPSSGRDSWGTCRNRSVRHADEPATVQDERASRRSQWNNLLSQPSARPQQASQPPRRARHVREPMGHRPSRTRQNQKPAQPARETRQPPDVTDREAPVQDQSPARTT